MRTVPLQTRGINVDQNCGPPPHIHSQGQSIEGLGCKQASNVAPRTLTVLSWLHEIKSCSRDGLQSMPLILELWAVMNVNGDVSFYTYARRYRYESQTSAIDGSWPASIVDRAARAWLDTYASVPHANLTAVTRGEYVGVVSIPAYLRRSLGPRVEGLGL